MRYYFSHINLTQNFTRSKAINLRTACRCGDPKRNANNGKIRTNANNREPVLAVQTSDGACPACNSGNPWGLDFGTSPMAGALEGGAGAHRYLYNGKEKVSDLGLNLYEYGFRWHDPQLGRFVQVDPLAMDYAYKSTYDYAENSPVAYIDMDGLEKLKSVTGMQVTWSSGIDRGTTQPKPQIQPASNIQIRSIISLTSTVTTGAQLAFQNSTIANKKIGSNCKIYEKFNGNKSTKVTKVADAIEDLDKAGRYLDVANVSIDGINLANALTEEGSSNLTAGKTGEAISELGEDLIRIGIGRFSPLTAFVFGSMELLQHTPQSKKLIKQTMQEEETKKYLEAILNGDYSVPRPSHLSPINSSFNEGHE